MKHSKDLAVIILAAGRGTRMRSDKPKVMHELAGLPMVNWLLKTVEGLDPARAVVVVGPDMSELEAAVTPHEVVVQEVRDGTGGAARIAAEALGDFDGDVLILLGDAPLVRAETLRELVAARQGDGVGLSILGCRVDNPFGYGRVVSRDGLVERIVEEKDATEEERAIDLINTGAFCVDGMALRGWLAQVGNDNAQGEFYITDLPAIAAAKGVKTAVAVCRDEDEVRGVNTLGDLAVLEGGVRRRLCEQAMAEGVRIIDPATTYLHHDTVLAAGVVVEPSVVFGDGVSVAEGAQIKAFSYIEDAEIGVGAVIGPFARLRGGVVMEEASKVGTFVEVKKSVMGAGSKVPHLSYVGDCVMGAGVNFGAGAITANYDGFEKHQTRIDDGAFVGTNVNLIAPVHVGEGAFVAAGSTVSEDVPADALALERSGRKILSGWASKFRARKSKG